MTLIRAYGELGVGEEAASGFGPNGGGTTPSCTRKCRTSNMSRCAEILFSRKWKMETKGTRTVLPLSFPIMVPSTTRSLPAGVVWAICQSGDLYVLKAFVS